MKTWMVMVNNHWMVKTQQPDDRSGGGIEHDYLDMDGVISAQAFSEKEIGTAWFVRDWLTRAEVISDGELRQMAREYASKWKIAAEFKDEESRIEHEYQELKLELECKKRELEAARENARTAWCDACNYQVEFHTC